MTEARGLRETLHCGADRARQGEFPQLALPRYPLAPFNFRYFNGSPRVRTQLALTHCD